MIGKESKSAKGNKMELNTFNFLSLELNGTVSPMEMVMIYSGDSGKELTRCFQP